MLNKKIESYVTKQGACPFDEWFFSLSEYKQVVVTAYIKRVASGGSKKNIRALKDGLFEIKIAKEGGLRIYFGEDGDYIILLLSGGDKASQKRDITKAKKLWSEYGKQK